MAFTDPRTPRQKALSDLQAMKNERASWDPHYAEVATHLLPRSSRFTSSDRNRGGRLHNNIYDNTGTRSLRILGAGLMGGATSPARPWFRLATPDRELMKLEPVKLWLNEVQQLMLDVFSRSNTYRSLHTMYEELGAFGTACSVMTDDFDNVIHQNTMTIGEFSLATDHRNIVDTMAREIDMTVSQVIKRFGYANCSQAVKNLWNAGNYTAWVPIIHIIAPNVDRQPFAEDNKNMAWKSQYLEAGAGGGEQKDMLRVSGFKQFRVLAPRWSVTSNDIYGHSPGMEALGDIKSLQHEQVRKAECIDYKTKPPLQIPTKLKGRLLDSLPGGRSYYDATAPGAGVRSLFEVNLDLSHLLQDIQDVRERIRAAFYTDLFLMLSQADNSRRTATEVAELHEEKLLMLGPVLERLHNELLDPLINMTFQRLVTARGPGGMSLLPPPPPELEGQELRVEFISMLAQAQRSVNINAIDRYVMSLGQLALAKPGVLDKFDEDKWADIYADRLGIDPELIVSGDKVAIIRKSREEQQQAMQQAALMQQSAETAKVASQADTSGKNGLTDMINSIQNRGAPQPSQTQ